MEYSGWEKLHYDLIQINENIMQLEDALERSVVDLDSQLRVDFKKLNELKNKIMDLQKNIASKFNELENKALESDGLNTLIGNHVPLKHKIVQHKFKLNEECINVLNHHKQLINSISNTCYLIQVFHTNLQTLKSIRENLIELEQNFCRWLNPQFANYNYYYDYQPFYMIKETLDKLRENSLSGREN